MTKYIFLLPIVFFGCSETENQNEVTPEETVEISLEDQIQHKIEASLNIQGNENYTFETFSAHCNSDKIEDKVFAINLLDRAKDKAIQSKNPNASAQTGYTGNYNYILFMNGADTTFSEPKPIPSSAMAPLKISFENIQNQHFKSIVVDAKVMNGGYRYFYFLVGIQPAQVLYVPLYENLGTPDAVGYSVKYQEGSYSLAKDVVVYDGKMIPATFSHSDEVYEFYPTIVPTDKINRRWFYHNKQMKYFTMKD